MAKKDEATSPGIEVKVDGKTYTIRPDELTGRDVRDFRAEVGFSPAAAFRDTTLIDIDVVAGLVWLQRRRTRPTLSYDDVLGEINYGNTSVDVAGGGDEGDSPEA